MSELAQLQGRFCAALASTSAPARTGPALRGDPELAARRLAVYRNNIRLMRINALAAAYPLVRNIVGAEFFAGLARAYAIAHDARSGDLNEYGDEFAPFLAGFEPARELPYLPDVARLEWLAHRAYYAADAAGFDPARLAALPQERWGELCLELHPALALLRSPWPLARIREVNLPGYAGDMQVDFSGADHYIMVSRPGYEVCVTQLDAGPYAWLQALARGLTLARALAAGAAAQADFDLAGALQHALQHGALVNCHLPEETP
jgi:hypothetical protein